VHPPGRCCCDIVGELMLICEKGRLVSPCRRPL
jgi:hypothetical protein